MVGKATTKIKGTRKPGRNRKGQNLKYISERRHAKSHIRRIRAHLARYGKKDKKAVETQAWYERQ
jgi:hypothetical protein